MSDRSLSYRKRWQELLARYGKRCFYCRKEVATTIDHVVPYSWDQDNSINNLVPACVLCNCLASNKMFDSIEHKRQYILEQRKKRINQRAICRDCLLPFQYRVHSPSLILCPECYDTEYGTRFSKTKEWRNWIKTLWIAGIPVEAHRQLKQRMEHMHTKDYSTKLDMLIEEYSLVVNSDDEFAEMLMMP